MNFEELSDDEWMMVSSLVSDEPPIRINRRGRPRAEPRVVANAVLWILTTGESWSRLPARYPSGPTCRRRFDEWHASGTLVEIVQRLTQSGRSFVYVPEPPQPVAETVAAIADETDPDDGLPAVYWKSPDAWQAPASRADAPLADPIESMTRQLVAAEPPVLANDAPPAAPVHARKRAHAPVAPASVPVPRDESPVAARSPTWTNRTPHLAQVAEWRGYVMKLTVQPVRNRMYRAAVEILKDNQRVERSGLIGPPFQDRDAAKRFALDWGRDWIERECVGGPAAQAAAPGQHTAGAAVAHAPANAVVTRTVPVVTNAVTNAVTSAVTNAVVNAVQNVAPNVVPSTVADAVASAMATTGAPANARLVPLQRFTASGALVSANDRRDSGAEASRSSERRSADPQYRPRTRAHAG
ncbi:transposase [Paraburkholderia denitrificans]|uniref:Transposase n=1 Tax=Paraburkholderia denitrificans TaxID=694025 RepID=A0ABW0JAB3_9BURK